MAHKIIQIAVASDQENGDILYGLDDAGYLYIKANAYVPRGTEISPGHVTTRATYGDPYWLPISMPFSSPVVTIEQLKNSF